MTDHATQIRELRYPVSILRQIVELPVGEQAHALAAIPDLLVLREVKQLLVDEHKRRGAAG